MTLSIGDRRDGGSALQYCACPVCFIQTALFVVRSLPSYDALPATFLLYIRRCQIASYCAGRRLTAVNTVKKIRYLKCGAVWNAHRPLWERVTKLDGIPPQYYFYGSRIYFSKSNTYGPRVTQGAKPRTL